MITSDSKVHSGGFVLTGSGPAPRWIENPTTINELRDSLRCLASLMQEDIDRGRVTATRARSLLLQDAGRLIAEASRSNLCGNE